MPTTTQTVNLRIVRAFLSLPGARQEEIRQNGTGDYCLVLPDTIAGYLERHPELETLDCWRELRHEGRRYLVFSGLPLGLYDPLSKLPGAIWIPYASHGKTIEEMLS